MTACVTAACTKPDPHQTSWSISFVNSELQGRAAVVEAEIVIGGCNGGQDEVVYTALIPMDDTGNVPRPPVLKPGTYGVRAKARSGECVVFAEGCQAVAFPLATPTVAVSLLPAASESAACGNLQCVSGQCINPNADGGTDGSTLDSATGKDGDADAGDSGDGSPDADSGPACPLVSANPSVSKTGTCPNTQLISAQRSSIRADAVPRTTHSSGPLRVQTTV